MYTIVLHISNVSMQSSFQHPVCVALGLSVIGARPYFRLTVSDS